MPSRERHRTVLGALATTPMATPTTNRRLLLIERPLFWVLLALAYASVSFFCADSAPESEAERGAWTEYAAHREAARRMVGGEPIYRSERRDSMNIAVDAPGGGDSAGSSDAARLEPRSFSQPPFAALLATVTLVAEGDRAGYWIWFGILFACLVGGMLCLHRLVLPMPDPRLQGRERQAWLGHYEIGPLAGADGSSSGWLNGLSRVIHTRSGLFFIVALVAALPHLIDSPLTLMEGHAVVFFAAVAGGLALARGKHVLGGICLGIAAAWEGSLLLALPWLLWKRQWRAAASLFVTVAAVSVLPDLLFPAADGRFWVVQWPDTVATSWQGGASDRSLVGAFVRVFADGSDSGAEIAGLGWLSLGAAKGMAYGLLLALAGFAMWAARPMPQGKGESREAWAGFRKRRWTQRMDEPDSVGVARELGLVLALCVLASPLANSGPFGALVVGYLVIVREAMVTRDRAMIVIAVVVLMFAVFDAVAGRDAADWVAHWGVRCGAILAVILGLLRSCTLARRG